MQLKEFGLEIDFLKIRLLEVWFEGPDVFKYLFWENQFDKMIFQLL